MPATGVFTGESGAMMSSQLARAAAWYARHGWTVFPLRPHTKEPFGGLGVYNATRDLAQVAEWWQRWPQANIGLHCGGCGLLALDIDAYKDTYAGVDILTREDEETITNLTGGGGTHLLYTTPEGTRYGNNKGNLPPGVDIRGWGGYIVLPPSIHPNGNLYRWESGYRPDEIAPLPLPAGLRAMLDMGRAVQRTAGPPDKFAVAVAQKLVQSVLGALEIETYPAQVYDGDGRKWILKFCPFNPAEEPHENDKAAFVVIARDGYISAGCQHERCRNRLAAASTTGWRFLLGQRARLAAA